MLFVQALDISPRINSAGRRRSTSDRTGLRLGTGEEAPEKRNAPGGIAACLGLVQESLPDPAGKTVDSEQPAMPEMRRDRLQRRALGEVESTNGPPGPMSALGGSGRAAPKEEVRV